MIAVATVIQLRPAVYTTEGNCSSCGCTPSELDDLQSTLTNQKRGGVTCKSIHINCSMHSSWLDLYVCVYVPCQRAIKNIGTVELRLSEPQIPG